MFVVGDSGTGGREEVREKGALECTFLLRPIGLAAGMVKMAEREHIEVVEADNTEAIATLVSKAVIAVAIRAVVSMSALWPKGWGAVGQAGTCFVLGTALLREPFAPLAAAQDDGLVDDLA